jgi:hypothetical protein
MLLVAGHAFLAANNGLYNEENDLLRDAYLSGKTCLVDFEFHDVSLADINWAQCM